MAIFDTFDGADGTIVRTRPGWLATSGGSTNQPVLNGSGAVRTLDAASDNNTGLTLHDAGDLSHFAESVIGADALTNIASIGTFSIVKASTQATVNTSYLGVAYTTATNTLRLVAGTADVSTAVHQLNAGDVVRTEAEMNGGNTAVTLRVLVNGVLRIGPVVLTSYLTGTCVGFRARTSRTVNPFITSFSGGALVAAVAPVLTDAQASGSGTTGATGSVVTSQGGGNLRYLVNTSPTATAAQISASGFSMAAPQAGYYAVGPVTELTPNTTYYMHFLHESPSGNSNVLSSGAFATEALPVQLVLGPLKNNTGTVLANQTGVTVHLYNVASGDKVVSKTGQSSDISGNIAVLDAALVSGTQYRAVIVLASGAEGLVKATAA